MAVQIGVKQTDLGWCGVSSEGYTTDGWPTEEIAIERIKQHKAEVEAGRDPKGNGPAAPMEPLEAFRERHGLIPDSDGRRALKAPGVKLVEDVVEDSEEDGD